MTTLEREQVDTVRSELMMLMGKVRSSILELPTADEVEPAYRCMRSCIDIMENQISTLYKHGVAR